MLGMEELFIAALGFLLWKGGKKTPSSSSSTPAATPSSAPWPAAAEPQNLATRADQEQARHDQLAAHLDAQADAAYKKAGNDPKARDDIKKKYKAQKAALDAMQRDINEAKAVARGDKAAADAARLDKAMNE